MRIFGMKESADFDQSHRSFSPTETDYPSGRIWKSLFSASHNSSSINGGHEDKLSVQANYLHCASVKTYNLRFFQKDIPSVCINTVVVRPPFL